MIHSSACSVRSCLWTIARLGLALIISQLWLNPCCLHSTTHPPPWQNHPTSQYAAPPPPPPHFSAPTTPNMDQTSGIPRRTSSELTNSHLHNINVRRLHKFGLLPAIELTDCIPRDKLVTGYWWPGLVSIETMHVIDGGMYTFHTQTPGYYS